MNLDTQSLQPIINFIWTVADDVLINKYLENQYQDVILPMTVLRRLDLALEPTKDKVLKTHNEFKSKMDNLSGLLTSKEHGSGLEFYNTSPYTMKKLLDDPKNIDANFDSCTKNSNFLLNFYLPDIHERLILFLLYYQRIIFQLKTIHKDKLHQL